MDEAGWQELLGTFTVHGRLAPANDEQLDTYERESGFRLPASYRAFCRVFGPGTLDDWYDFAVPGCEVKDPRRLELTMMNTDRRAGLEWEEYAQDIEQFLCHHLW